MTTPSEQLAIILQAIFTQGSTIGPINQFLDYAESVALGEETVSELPENTRFIGAESKGDALILQTNNGTFHLTIAKS